MTEQLGDPVRQRRRIPAGMLFAPSIGGRSHSEAEDTAPGDLVLAATALTNGIAELLGH